MSKMEPKTVKQEANATALSIVQRTDGKKELRRLNYNKETNSLVSTDTLLVSNTDEVSDRFKIEALESFFE